VESLAARLSTILLRRGNDHSEAESFMRLDRIYTRGGDAGLTSLGDGTRIPKFYPRIAAMGGLDEANAAIGLALLHIDDAATRDLRRFGPFALRPRGDAARRTGHRGARLIRVDQPGGAEICEPAFGFVVRARALSERVRGGRYPVETGG
jgi:hypothetical protein